MSATSATRARSDPGVLEVEEVTVTFRSHGGSLVAVDSVSLSLPAGGTLGLVGESGSGKTTLARCLTGLIASDRGRILFDGVELPRRRSRAEHRAVQIVFQDPYSSLNPRLRMRSVLTELLTVHGLARGAAAERRCRELMALVGLPASALDGQPLAFSGGQRQRLAIARALAVEPRVLIVDEPTSALDVSVQATILALFEDLRARVGISVLMISHNLAAVRHLCDRVAVMYLGRIVEIGSRAEVFSDARHPYTQALLAAAPRIRRDVAVDLTRLGEPPSPTDRPSGCPFHPRCPRAEEICSVKLPPLAPARGTGGLAACHFRDERRVPEQLP
jgi:oligopeptide/dipeptide ABC transporter ATP-binding protein